jgi:hypothetical protein
MIMHQSNYVRFEVSIAVVMMIFWVLAPCKLVGLYGAKAHKNFIIKINCVLREPLCKGKHDLARRISLILNFTTPSGTVYVYKYLQRILFTAVLTKR